MTKRFWKSKTFWFNLLSMLVVIAMSFGYGSFVPDPAAGEYATVIITIVNIVLRFTTDRAIK